MPFINSYDPFLTSSSPLLFYSLPFSYFWMSVFNFKGFFFVFLVRTVEALKMSYVNVFWLGSLCLLIFCIFLSYTGSSSIGVLCWSFQLMTLSLVALPSSSCSVLLCYSSDRCRVTCMTSVILLTFSSSTFWLSAIYLSALCLVRSCVINLLMPRIGGPDSCECLLKCVSSVVPC